MEYSCKSVAPFGKCLTKRLRRIHNAWQFWFKSALVFTAQWFRLGGRVVHHLTRRYVKNRYYALNFIFQMPI
ncbi:hypothetical protein EIB86_23800 [Vibrio parahaemolyticus]|nr:hypothetical protein [Vibrio parahaemolyticus]